MPPAVTDKKPVPDWRAYFVDPRLQALIVALEPQSRDMRIAPPAWKRHGHWPALPGPIAFQRSSWLHSVPHP